MTAQGVPQASMEQKELLQSNNEPDLRRQSSAAETTNADWVFAMESRGGGQQPYFMYTELVSSRAMYVVIAMYKNHITSEPIPINPRHRTSLSGI